MKNHKQKPVIDRTIVLLLVRYLMLKDRYFSKDLIKILNESLEYKSILSSKDLRTVWLYMMNNHQLYCSICGNQINNANHDFSGLTKDHVVAKSLGGQSIAENFEPAHHVCNELKSNHTVEEWEKEGLSILKRSHITVNTAKTIYNYRQR